MRDTASPAITVEIGTRSIDLGSARRELVDAKQIVVPQNAESLDELRFEVRQMLTPHSPSVKLAREVNTPCEN